MALKKTVPLSKKVDKTILGALAVAQRYPGLRLIFRRVSAAFTSGRLSKIGDIPKVKGFQSATDKLTKVEQNWYTRVLVPIGFPVLASFRVVRDVTVKALQIAPDVARKVVNVKRLEKNLQLLPTHLLVGILQDFRQMTLLLELSIERKRKRKRKKMIMTFLLWRI